MRAPDLAPPRAAIRLGGLLAVLLGAGFVAGGCGTKFDLPTERRDVRSIAGAGTYQMIKTRAGLAGIRDVLLTPGGELFLLFKASATGAARVQEFPQSLGEPLSTSFPELLNPQALAFGANRIFVLDQGDTNAARTNQPTDYLADCGPVPGFTRPIADLSKYWVVREYHLNGDSAVSSFSDTVFAWVNGIASDNLGRVYVSGVVIYCDVDPFDPRIKTLSTRFRVHRYQRGTPSGTVVGGNWRRDPGWEIPEGTGIGSTLDPRGMHWASPDGPALYFADRGNDEVQKFSESGSSFKIDIGGSGLDSVALVSPIDVTVDSAGYVYLADTGNKRVLRYDPDGRFVQRVDIELDEFLQPIDEAAAVAADNEQVYVVDAARGEVVRYRRRK